MSLFLQPRNEHDCDIYYCHWQSIIAGFQEVKKEIIDLGLSTEIEVMNLDDFSDIHSLPMKDFIVLKSFDLDVSKGEVCITFHIGVSTYEDANNHRLAKIISYIYGIYFPGKAQYILDKKGVEKAVITFTEGTMVNPMSKAELRSTQFITVAAVSTATAF